MGEKKLNMHLEGEAVFLNFMDCKPNEEDNVWDLRQQAKLKLLGGDKPTRYVVTGIVDMNAGELNDMLGNESGFTQYLQATTGDMDEEIDDVFSCVLFMDMKAYEGVIIHRRAEQWLVASVPAIDFDNADRELNAAGALTALASLAEGVPIRLDRDIAKGRYMLSEVLEMIAEQISV